MKLIECHVGSFGTLKNLRVVFNDGLNLRLGGNGSGKSTLAAFIRVMLYGMNDSKKSSLTENDRRHYLPWDDTPCRGSLTVEVAGKRYRIERSFGKKQSEDRYRLFSLESGKECNDYPEKFAEEIFGIDAEGFEKTAYFSERSLKPSGINLSLTSRLGGGDATGNESDLVAKAIDIIEEQRRYYYKRGGGGELASIRDSIRAEGKRRDESFKAKEELIALREKSRKLESAIIDKRNERAALANEKHSLNASLREKGREGRIYALREEYDEVRKRRDEAREKFKKEPPTLDLVNEEYIRMREAQIKECERDLSLERSRLSALKEYFDGKCDGDEIAAVEDAILKAEANEKEIARTYEIFKKRVPDPCELKGLRAKKGGTVFLTVLMILTTLFAIVFGVCGYLFDRRAYLLSLMAVGVVLVLSVILALVTKAAKDRELERIRAFIFATTGEEIKECDAVSRLDEIETLIAKKEDSSDKEYITVIENFTVKFFTRGTVNAILAAKDLIEKYKLIGTLESSLEGGKSESGLDSGEELYKKEKSVLDLESPLALEYPEVCRGTLRELRDAVMEYESLKDRAARIGAEIESFCAMKVLGEDDRELTQRLEEIEGLITKATDEEEALTREHTLTESRIGELSEIADELDSREARVDGLSQRLGDYEKNLEILRLTRAHIEGASEAINSSYLDGARCALLKYLGMLSDNPDGLSIDSSFKIQRTEDGVTREAEAYSRGLLDLYLFAARLALVDALYEKEQPILILDDPFTALDDIGIKRATDLICELSKSRQIIYLCCSESRLPKSKRKVQ